MVNPTTLIARIVNVNGELLQGGHLEVIVRKGATILGRFTSTSPGQVNLTEGFVQVEISASAPLYYTEAGVLLFGVFNRWDATNGSWKLSESGLIATLDIPLGRVRFAPVISLPDSLEVPPDYVPPGIVLENRPEPQYRGFWPDEAKNMMILRRPALRSLDNAVEWDRFACDAISINLGKSGNWIFLEYGDPPNEGDNVRFLLGVWAPHSTPHETPAVVVQITPNPQGGREGTAYPVDRFPFTGRYPYGMLPETYPKGPAATVQIRQMHQRYPDLAIDRSLLAWHAVYQIYGARPDLFSGPNGPIVITIVPAATNDGVQRAPMSHREGVGRMIAEVIRFLWSERLTLYGKSGRMKMLFPNEGIGKVTTAAEERAEVIPNGFPARVSSTVLTHSAGSGALAELAGPFRKFPSRFAGKQSPNVTVGLWGGSLTYGEDNWKGIWLMDGVARDGDNVMFQPKKGSSIVDIWKNWIGAFQDRRLVAVYCEAGLSAVDQNGLVDHVRRVANKDGWVEEGETPDKKIAWIRFSNSILAPTEPSRYPNAIPRFGGRRRPHDDVFMIGIGYAARTSP